MHREILTAEQLSLLRFIKQFQRSFFLVGGTAVALYLGHRRSVDFDLFSKNPLNLESISKKIRSSNVSVNKVYVKKSHEFTLLINQVKFTFYHYDFPVEAKTSFEGIIRLPSLLQLAAMKAHALGGRAKWKDYVDLYFILKDYLTLKQISDEAVRLFQGEFNPKLFRIQLSTFNDITYEEKVDFLKNPVPEKEVKKFLTWVGTSK